MCSLGGVRSPLPAVTLALAVLGCPTPKVEPPPKPTWVPGTTYRTPREPNARGLLDRKGLIHAHSYYSHDACDSRPITDAGTYDAVCYDDFRRGLCQTKHDFVFLTDHRGTFADNEFPDVLLYDAARSDRLVEHGAGPTANWLACPEAEPALVMAGCETTPMMPVGLERHATGRGDTYGSDTTNALLEARAAGAVTLVAHTEGWTVDKLATLPLDGFEMYNLHANTFKNAGVVLDYMMKVDAQQFDGLPEPDAFLASYTLEDQYYLETWGSVLARGVKRVTTMGTDCHRNSLPQKAQDGERIDSYRRMMLAFSNHLLVRPKADGTWDDRDLKDALRGGRLYGVFDSFGDAQGFDYFATEGAATKEMGDEASVAAGATLVVKAPTPRDLPADVEAPTLTVKLFKAKSGGWDEVASGPGDLSFTPTAPGAYRAEVRLVPRHMRRWIGKRLDWLRAERPWVYSNPIYVVP